MSMRGDGARLIQASRSQTIVIPNNEFRNSNAAMDRLFELFPDHYPTLIADRQNEWTFELDWPRHILEPIDPLLPEMARTCFDLDLSELARYMEIRSCRNVPFVFSMFHSWALLAPVLTMQLRGMLPTTVVHVDAHHDLSSCLLGFVSTGRLGCQAVNIECRFDDVATVEAAISLGFINKASFLTAYVLGLEAGRLIHVDRKRNHATFFLNAHSRPITIGKSLLSEHTLSFDQAAANKTWPFFEGSEIPIVTPDDSEQIWLDVDLDAFCNRFDGDSDNRDAAGTKAERHEIERQIDVFLQMLEVDWVSRIGAVSVAASPGFFPSEYWEIAIPRLCDGIARLL